MDLFAKMKADKEAAMKSYKRLAQLAIQLVSHGADIERAWRPAQRSAHVTRSRGRQPRDEWLMMTNNVLAECSAPRYALDNTVASQLTTSRSNRSCLY